MPTDSDEPIETARGAVSSPEPRQDEHGRLVASLSCRSCGYDLKGSACDGICPECATPVERSMRGDLLEFSDPGWLARIARGLLVIVCGIIGGILLQIGMIIASVVASLFVTFVGGPGNAMGIVLVAGGLGTAIVAVVNIIGAWLVTTQDPGRTETERPVSVRSVARFAIMVSLIAAPMQMLMGQFGTLSGGTGAGIRAVDVVIMVFGVGAALCALVGWVAFYVYVRQIALRVPLERMARQLRVIVWGYAISTIFSVGVGFTSTLLVATGRMTTTGTNMSAGMQVVAVGVSLGSCGGVLAFMIFELWAAILFLRLRGRLTALAAR